MSPSEDRGWAQTYGQILESLLRMLSSVEVHTDSSPADVI